MGELFGGSPSGAEEGGSCIPVAACHGQHGHQRCSPSACTGSSCWGPWHAPRPLPAPLHHHARGVGVPGPGCLHTPQLKHGVPVPPGKGPSCHGAMLWLLAPRQTSATATWSLTPCRCKHRVLSGPGAAGCRSLPLLPEKITWGHRGLGSEKTQPGEERQQVPQPAPWSSPATGKSPPGSAQPWGISSAWCQETRSGAPGSLRSQHPGAWGQLCGGRVPVVSCQHSLGIHERACECSARGSALQGTRGGQGRQEAGSQLTLTHWLGTRQLVQCCAAQVTAACDERSDTGMQGQGCGAESCGSQPCLVLSISVRMGAPGWPQAAPGTLMAQGAVASPKLQLLLSTLTAGAEEGAWLQGRGSQGSPLCWGYCHPTGRPDPHLSGDLPAPCMLQGTGWGPCFGQGGRRASNSQAGDLACVPPKRCWGGSSWGHAGLTSPAQMSLPSFIWHSKEKESDHAL